jgi:predicted pyridoxine 5'-phosphate oxidase superfamily flavin-nucleotide-binding protein
MADAPVLAEVRFHNACTELTQTQNPITNRIAHTVLDNPAIHLPGSEAERAVQQKYGSTPRANAFYKHQVLDHINHHMAAFIARQEMMFVGTADGNGHADASFRAGDAGFVRVLNQHTMAYPEYRGNGVMASVGNISDNPHVGLLFVDFRDRIGLHVNGPVKIMECEEFFLDFCTPDMVRINTAGDTKRPERWVVVYVVEAYIHCSKHIPRLQKVSQEIQWGTDDPVLKGGDYFKVKGTKALRNNA